MASRSQSRRSRTRWVISGLVLTLPTAAWAQGGMGMGPAGGGNNAAWNRPAAAPAAIKDDYGGKGLFKGWFREQSEQHARSEFEKAEQLFRQENYADAAKTLAMLASRYKDTPLEEEVLFLLAESQFKLEQLPKAQDNYAKLMVKFPTTRHLADAVQRTYDIAYYWLEDSKARTEGKPTRHSRFTQRFNLIDRTRPLFDTEGRAIEAIEAIHSHDPDGPLTDDALMLAGAHQFVEAEYLKAANYYEQLSADQPKSQHAPKALLLGADAYLRAYEGPEYQGQDLQKAAQLLKQASIRGQQLDPEQREQVDRNLRVIEIEIARRDFERAELYLRMRKPSAARYYFTEVIRKHRNTEWADRSEEELRRLDANPQAASPLFGWLGTTRYSTPNDAGKPTEGNEPSRWSPMSWFNRSKDAAN